MMVRLRLMVRSSQAAAEAAAWREIRSSYLLPTFTLLGPENRSKKTAEKLTGAFNLALGHIGAKAKMVQLCLDR
jgi:hypothetical protein